MQKEKPITINRDIPKFERRIPQPIGASKHYTITDFNIYCTYESNYPDEDYVLIEFDKIGINDDGAIFEYKYEVNRNQAIEIKKCIDTFQIHLNDKNIAYSRTDIEELRKILREEIDDCIRDKKKEEHKYFDRQLVISFLRSNVCDFSFSCINKILEKVRNGSTQLVPGVDSVPRVLEFLSCTDRENYSEDKKRCFSYIEKIIVLDLKDIEKDIDINNIRANFIFGIIDSKSKKMIILCLGFIGKSEKSSDFKYYSFKTSKSIQQITFYNIEEASIVAYTKCKFADKLLHYHDYYSLLLYELEHRNDNQNIIIALDFLHNFYLELDNLTIDEGSTIIPVLGKTFRFKEIQIDCYLDGKVVKYPFYGGEVHPLNGEETEEIKSRLSEYEIFVPDSISFIRLDYSDLGDKDQSLIRTLIASGKYNKVQIGYNITGDITRTKRIIEGIEKCLSNDVSNSRLVELICSNDINNDFEKMINSNHYEPDEVYIETLRSKYWMFKENNEQIETIDKIVQMDKNGIDLMLVQGPPGTGKTELILSLIKELYSMNYKVLVTSNVQVACDNIVDRLKNFRNIALKRYSTIKGEKYEKEIIDNEQKYIKNQILEGFSLSLKNGKNQDLVLFSEEQYAALFTLKEEYEKKICDIDDEIKKYIEDLKEYTNLDESKKNSIKLIDSLASEVESINGNLNKISNKEKESQDSLNEQVINQNKIKEKINETNDETSKFLTIREELESSLKTIYKNKDDIKNKISNERSELKDLEIRLIKKKELANSIETSIERFDSISISIITKQLIYYLNNEQFDYSQNYPLSFFEELFGDVIPLIDFGKFVKNIVSQDKDFLDNKKPLSTRYFDSIYYKVKDNYNCASFFGDDFIPIIEDVRKFYNISPLIRFILIFPFIKIEGKNKNYYTEKISVFNDSIKKVYYSFDDLIKEIIKKYFSKEELNKKKSLIEQKKTNALAEIKSIEGSIKIVKSNIKEADRELFATGNIIDEKTIELNKTNVEIEKLSEKAKSYNDNLELCNKQIDMLSKTIKKLANEKAINLQELNDKTSKMNAKQVELAELEKAIQVCYEKNWELIDDYENFMQAKEVARLRNKKNLDTINDVIQTFDVKISELTSSGWSKEEARKILFDYTKEVDKIAQFKNDQSDEELKYYLDGYGTSFREMFELTDTGKGSIISMTTNQVASLLKSTSDDKLTFDYAIIDEASKCTFEDIVISLPRVKHLILIGDFMQLDKLYEKFDQIDLKYQDTLSYSLWDSLNMSTFYQFLKIAVKNNEKHNLITFNDNAAVSVMKKQYRMNRGIFNLVKPIYDIHKEFELVDQKHSTFNDLLCVQIDGSEMRDNNKSTLNQKEAFAIVNILGEISKHREKYPGIQKIGVITGYRAQEKTIRNLMKGAKKIRGLEIGTFDRFQGREYDLVLVSMVRTESLGFTSNLRRMNVAMSRAKNHLIIFGNFKKLLSISKKTTFIYDDDFEPNKDELEFVTKKLIPQLYNLRIEYPSSDEMCKSIAGFLKEEDDDE